MKKSILILATAFTLNAFFTSCRETSRTDDVEVNNDIEEFGEEIEEKAEEAGESIEEGAEEVEQEVQTTDDY